MIEERKKHTTLEIIEKYLTEFEALSNEIKSLAFPEKPSWNIENCCLYALSNVNITPNEV